MSFGIFILNIYDVFSMNIKNFKSLLNDDCWEETISLYPFISWTENILIDIVDKADDEGGVNVTFAQFRDISISRSTTV